MQIDHEFFEVSTISESYPSSTCPKCIITPPDPEKDYGECKVCLQHAYDWNHIESHVFIRNIENIMNELDDDAISLILSDYKRAKYDCFECSSIEDDQYYCTTCEGDSITEVDRILFELKENGKHKIVKKLEHIIDTCM